MYHIQSSRPEPFRDRHANDPPAPNTLSGRRHQLGTAKACTRLNRQNPESQVPVLPTSVYASATSVGTLVEGGPIE